MTGSGVTNSSWRHSSVARSVHPRRRQLGVFWCYEASPFRGLPVSQKSLGAELWFLRGTPHPSGPTSWRRHRAFTSCFGPVRDPSLAPVTSASAPGVRHPSPGDLRRTSSSASVLPCGGRTLVDLNPWVMHSTSHLLSTVSFNFNAPGINAPGIKRYRD